MHHISRKLSLSRIVPIVRNLQIGALVIAALALSSVRATAAVSGTKTALVMLVSLNDAAIDCSIAEVNGMMFTNQPLNVDSFYNEATWGAVRWSGNVIAVSVNHSMTPCNADTWANSADTAARAQGYEPNNYTARIYAFPSAAGSCGYAWASGNRVVTFHCSDLFAYGHEVGHTIGLHHATTDPNNDGVIDNDYGGMDDCMGGESYTFNAPHKIWGGWLPQRETNGGWRQITSDGTYQISPLQINPTNNPPYSQALKIVPPTGIPYFLSFRQPLGFDQGWTATQVGKDGRSGTIVDPVPPISAYPYTSGVGIHRHSGGTGAVTYEIAVLGNNQQFAIPGTGIVIRQTAYDFAKVTLNITGFNGGTVANGVTFYQHPDFGGAQSQVLTPGNYNLSALNVRGIPNDWASSCKIPPGWTVILYQHDNFLGTSWTNTSDVASLSSLTPSGANDQLSSCRIIAGPGTPPVVPVAVSASGSNAQVALSWTPSPGAAGYVIKRSLLNGGPYTPVASSSTSAYVNTGLTNGTTYYYVVAASNTFGFSADSAPVTAVPTSDLVAYWKFDENAASTAGDSSGNGNHGTLVNAPTWFVPGKFGTAALTFNAANQRYVNVLNSSTLNPTKAITISAWIYAFDWSGNRRILQKGNSDNQYRLLAENSQLKFHLNGVDELTAPLPPVNTWMHLAATWDGVTMTLYTNGVVRSTKPASGTINTTADVLAIARKHNSGVSGDYFNGRLDDVRIYNRALGGAEVASILTNSPPRFSSNPLAKAAAPAGQPYSVSISQDVIDSELDAISFSKANGPSWLTVAPNGTLSGTPLSANVGTNVFTVNASDSFLASQASVTIEVLAPQAIVSAIERQGDDLLLTWTGGIGPFQLQARTNLVQGEWETVAESIPGNSFLFSPTSGALFYRIQGQ